MENKSLAPIKFFCGLACFYHVGEGIIATIGGDLAAKMAAFSYGLSLARLTPMTSQLTVLFRFIGAFAITFGVLMGFAAVNPGKNKAIIYGGIVFFAVRAFDRIIFANVLRDAFNVSTGRNLLSLIFVLIMLFGLLIFRPKGTSA
jgi:hypothetical protein